MKRKKKSLTLTDVEFAKRREEHERTQRLLAERIAYHEARIAERARVAGENPQPS